MLTSFYHTIILYSLLFLEVRLMGKRQLGQLEPSEFVATMLIADLAAIPIENTEMPIWMGIIPMATVLGIEALIAAASLRSVRLRKILCSKPMILIENGKMLQKNMKKAKVTLDELTGQLRQKDILQLQTVQYAILETDGNISVFPYPKERPATAAEAGVQVKKQFFPVTIVSDGCLLADNLKTAGKDRVWVEKILRQHDATVKSTWLLTVDGGDRVCFYPKD